MTEKENTQQDGTVDEVATVQVPKKSRSRKSAIAENVSSNDEIEVAVLETEIIEAEEALPEDTLSPPSQPSNGSREAPSDKKPSPFGRFGAWLSRLFRRSSASENLPSLVTVEEKPLSAKEIASRLKALEKQSMALVLDSSKKEAEAKALQDKIDFNELESEKIGVWVSRISDSFLWRVQKKMDDQLSTAKSDLARYEQDVKNVKVPEEGTLLKLRREFHKSLLRSLATLGPIVLVVVGLPYLFDLPRLDWLSALYKAETSGPIIVAFLVLVVGVILAVRRLSGKKIFTGRRIFKISLVLLLIGAATWAMPIVEPWFRSNVIPVIQKYMWQILSGVAATGLLWAFVALLIYYQGWTVFRQQVNEQLSLLAGVIDGYVKTQQEVKRLTSIYKQTSEWLEILAHALYRPWKTAPEWESGKDYESHFDTFPFALRVAQAKEEQDARMAELERLVGSRLLIQGWRKDAFDDLVKSVGLEMGLPDGKFNVDLLDSDLPHQTNNSRRILNKFLVNSAKSSKSGSLDLESNSVDESGKATRKPSDKYLIEVARERLLELIEKTQSVAITAARPRVQQIVNDPLAGLRGDSAGIEEFDSSESWDDFLSESLGTDEVSQPPMGILSFTDSGRVNRVQENPRSFIIVPKRLLNSLPTIKSERVSVVGVGDGSAKSVEIIARFDVVGPLDPQDVAVLGINLAPKPRKKGDSPVEMPADDAIL